MRDSMAEFPADADSAFETVLEFVSNFDCLGHAINIRREICHAASHAMSFATSKHVQSNSRKWRRRFLHFLKFLGTFDCLNLLAMFYSTSINAGSIFMVGHSTTFTS